MMGFKEETILEENQLEKFEVEERVKELRMERLQVRMRSQKRCKSVKGMWLVTGFGSCVIWLLRVMLCMKT